MEDEINYGKNMTLEELENLEEVDIEFDEKIDYVDGGICPDCNREFVRIIENRDTLRGDVTFHITKLKCPKCGKTYLDLNNAEKYDLLLRLEKAFNQPIEVLLRKIAGLV